MSALSDRLLLLLIVTVGLGSILVAWAGGYVQAEMTLSESVMIGVLLLALLVVLVGAYVEFRHLDEEAS